ncbi:MAG: ABC transporter substrate-binding protein [Acidobacteriota bacterium]
MRTVAALGIVVVMLASVASPAHTSAPAVVRMAMFSQTPLVVTVGQAQGLFAKFGVEVVSNPRWTSKELREGVASGEFDVVQSLVDNSIATEVMLKAPTIVIVGGDTANNSELVAQPEIKSIEDVKGTTVLVDSPDTAMALQLRKILRTKGLEVDRDYKMMPFAQTQKRWEALKTDKTYSATMMSLSPEARKLGFHALASAAQVVGPWMGSGLWTSRKFAETHSDALVGFLAGFVASQRWLRDPANEKAVVELLAKEGDPDAAQRTYQRSYTGKNATYDPGFDVEGFKAVLALRAEIEGTWGGKPPAPDRYYDLSYYKKALALLNK